MRCCFLPLIFIFLLFSLIHPSVCFNLHPLSCRMTSLQPLHPHCPPPRHSLRRITLLLPFLSLCIFTCVLFSPWLARHSTSFLSSLASSACPLPFSLFLSLCLHLASMSFSPPLSFSSILLQHTKQKFSYYFSSWETLDWTARLTSAALPRCHNYSLST